MSGFDISVDANNARLEGGLRNWLDDGPDTASADFFNTTRPATPGDPAGGAPLATMHFAKPCATLSSNRLEFAQLDAAADMVLVQGSALWARLYSADGSWYADCDVTDTAGAGPLKISGTTGTLLYAGALVVLATLYVQ